MSQSVSGKIHLPERKISITKNIRDKDIEFGNVLLFRFYQFQKKITCTVNKHDLKTRLQSYVKYICSWHLGIELINSWHFYTIFKLHLTVVKRF